MSCDYPGQQRSSGVDAMAADDRCRFAHALLRQGRGRLAPLASLLGPLQEGWLPTCPVLLFEGQVGLGDDADQVVVGVDDGHRVHAALAHPADEFLVGGGSGRDDQVGGHDVCDGGVHGAPPLCALTGGSQVGQHPLGVEQRRPRQRPGAVGKAGGGLPWSSHPRSWSRHGPHDHDAIREARRTTRAFSPPGMGRSGATEAIPT
jgi:hypothetical protein